MSDETPGGEARRWPSWVYGDGEEPDYRFSFANERTFLAWIRSALALLAAGVALDVVDLSLPDRVQHVLALVLVGLGVVCAAASWFRWAQAERAMRRRRPLPSFGFGGLLTLVVVLLGVTVLVLGA